MPRFLQALKFHATERLAAATAAEAAPPASASSAAVSLLRELAASLPSYAPDRARRCLAHHLGDKSQSERIFLAAVLLTVLLFVVIVPAFEALADGGDGGDGGDGEIEDGAVRSALPSPRVSMRMYQQGVGVVEVNVSGIAEAPLSRASSSGSSCGSSSMETIEESEEESWEDEDEDKHSVREDRKEVCIVTEASAREGRSMFTTEAQ